MDDVHVGQMAVNAGAAGLFRRPEADHVLEQRQAVGGRVGTEVAVPGPGAEGAYLVVGVAGALQGEERTLGQRQAPSR